MLGARTTRSGRALVTIVTGAILWTSIATVAFAADKTFSAGFVGSGAFDAGGSYGAGTRPVFQILLTNLSDQARFGSANIAAPVGVDLQAASIATDSPGTATLVAGVIQVRNLDLPPGGTATINVSAQIECASNPAHAPYTWTIAAKQANDFNGTGNDLAQVGLLTNTIEGTCSLEFSKEPASSANHPTIIRSKIYDPSPANPVTVRVKAFGADETVTWWNGLISLGFGDDPSGGTATLRNGTAASPTTGVITFGPTIDVTASGYSLIATASTTAGSASDGTIGAESVTFNIVDEADICGATTGCFVKTNGPKTITQVNAAANGGEAGDVVILSINPVVPPAERCAGIVPDSDLITFDVTKGDGITPSGRAKTATVTLLAQFVTKAASQYQVCYNDGTGPVQLATCANKTPTLPCVVSKRLDKAKNLVIVVAAPINDPKMNF